MTDHAKFIKKITNTCVLTAIIAMAGCGTRESHSADFKKYHPLILQSDEAANKAGEALDWLMKDHAIYTGMPAKVAFELLGKEDLSMENKEATDLTYHLGGNRDFHLYTAKGVVSDFLFQSSEGH